MPWRLARRNWLRRLWPTSIADRLNREDWHALERWLRLLPAQWIETQPWLLVAEAYVSHFQFQWNAIPPLLKKAEQGLRAADSVVDLAWIERC